MAAETAPQDKTPQDRDFKRSAYDFCEKAVARFEANASRNFNVSRQQTISGDAVTRTYIFTFEMRMNCELGD